MKWIALLLQLVSFRSSLLESRAMVENARAVAEKGKRAVVFSGFFLLALVYFLVGSVLAIIDLGLQVEKGEFFRFSGLLGSSVALMLLAALIVGIGVLVSGSGRAAPAPAPPPRPAAAPDVKALLEEFALTFLTRMATRLKEKRGSDEG